MLGEAGPLASPTLATVPPPLCLVTVPPPLCSRYSGRRDRWLVNAGHGSSSAMFPILGERDRWLVNAGHGSSSPVFPILGEAGPLASQTWSRFLLPCVPDTREARPLASQRWSRFLLRNVSDTRGAGPLASQTLVTVPPPLCSRYSGRRDRWLVNAGHGSSSAMFPILGERDRWLVKRWPRFLLPCVSDTRGGGTAG